MDANAKDAPWVPWLALAFSLTSALAGPARTAELTQSGPATCTPSPAPPAPQSPAQAPSPSPAATAWSTFVDEVEASVAKGLETLKARGVQAVTVSLMNAFANPAHERRIRELAGEILPGVPLSLSSDILPEMREYERALTTVANSYVRPTVAKYLANLENKLRGEQVTAKLKVLRSDGGLMSFGIAEEAPVNLLMSGPAGGVTGALWVCQQAGFHNLLTFDMGGTSTDVALIENGDPRVRRETRVGSVTVRASSLDVRTVGAGGGSIARVPELTKALRVGPESAGAAPGPAAYGRGGTQPTVTDANVVLG